MRRVFLLVALLGCHDGSKAPPTVVVPVASTTVVATTGATGATTAAAVATTDDAGAPTVRGESLGFLRMPPASVQALLDALSIPLASVWESRERSGMGSFSVRAPVVLSVQYRWDMYHQSPTSRAADLGPKSLESWSLTLPLERRDAVMRTLQSRWGAAQPKEKADHTAVEQYGAFFVANPSGGGESFTVEWFAQAPDWAKAKVDPAVRKKAVAELAKAVAAAQTVEEMQKAAASARAGAGITSKGAYKKTDANLEFEPPMNALDFAAAIGHSKLIAESVGVHMSQWKLAEVSGSGPATTNPRLGNWEIEASLSARPSGTRDPRFQTGPTARYGLSASDEVRYVRIAQPSP